MKLTHAERRAANKAAHAALRAEELAAWADATAARRAANRAAHAATRAARLEPKVDAEIPAAIRANRPMSLIPFLASIGGLKPCPDLAHMGVGDVAAWREAEMHNAARERAIETGCPF